MNKDYIVNNRVQNVPPFLCSLLTRIMAEQPLYRFYRPENTIGWLELT